MKVETSLKLCKFLQTNLAITIVPVDEADSKLNLRV